MSKKGKDLIFNPRLIVSEGDAKARSKLQTLVQEYTELQQESDVMRSKLQAAKQKKLTLAAEVRFLHRRRKLLVESKTMHALQVEKFAQTPMSFKKMKSKKAQVSTTHHKLPPKPVAKFNKKCYLAERVTVPSTSSPSNDRQEKKFDGKEMARQSSTPTSVLDYKGMISISHEMFAWKVPVVDLNKERIPSPHVAFDLNQESISLPARTPIFDLNEISMGDEDFQSNGGAAKFDDTKKSCISGLNNEQQNDLMLSMCRNAGKSSSSRTSKRKISWQDPVFLRV